MAYVALHTIDARHYLAKAVGLELEKPFEDVTAEARSVDDIKSYPPVNEMKAAWQRLSNRLEAFLSSVDPADLSRDAEFQFPIEDGSILGCVTFMLEHESFHIGQLAFLRKFYGLGAMKYES